MNAELGPIDINRKTGLEPFHRDGQELGFNLLGFWQWAHSDVLNNVLRGILAEYLVAQDLHIAEGIRLGWDSYDLKTQDGITIEVKSSSYLQSWHQDSLSRIIFGIPQTHAWSFTENRLEKEQRRQADVYVFCVLAHEEKSTVDPLNLNQWRFYVLSTHVLDREFGAGKSLSLPRLLQMNPVEARFGEIAQVVKRVAADLDHPA